MTNVSSSTIVKASSESLSLHGPITALSTVMNDQSNDIIFFAIGNEIRRISEIHKGRFFTQTVARLPDGVVVNSIATWPLRSSGSSSSISFALMAGGMNSVYLLKIDACERTRLIACICGGRILGIRVYEEMKFVTVLTARNTVRLFNMDDLQEILEKPERRELKEFDIKSSRLSGPLLPLVLAGDVLLWREDDEDLVRGAVFSATYSGNIKIWQFYSNEKNYLKEFSVGEGFAIIPSHADGCAIFSVKAIRRSSSCDFFVATCSDDRSLALFKCVQPGKDLSTLTSVLLWRGAGVSFSRRRIFDADMILDEQDKLLYCAAASEEGSVQVWRILLDGCGNSTHASTAVERVFYRSEQHNGHGTYKVRLLPRLLLLNLGNPTIRGDSAFWDFPFVVSAGFDGSIVANPVRVNPIPAEGCLATRIQFNAFSPLVRTRVISTDASRESLSNSSLNGGISAENKKQHIRGLFVDEQGRILYNTEGFLAILRGFSASPDSPTVEYFTWGDRSCVAARVHARVDRTLYPTTLTALGVRRKEEGPKNFYAFIGTEAGYLIVVPYPSPEKTSELSISPLWMAHRKVISLIVRDWNEPSTGSSEDSAILLCSSHADQSVMISCWCSARKSGNVLALCKASSSVLNTALQLCRLPPGTGEFDFIVLSGDKKGMLRVFGYSSSIDSSFLTTAEPKTLEAFHEMDLMSTAIARIDVDLSAQSEPTFLVCGDDARYQPLFLREVLSRDNSFSHRRTLGDWNLRFPMDISSVVTLSPGILVARRGAEIAVFSCCSPSLHSWRKVAAYDDIKAPRLMTAVIYENIENCVRVYCAHCSDGSTIHTHCYKLSLDATTPLSLTESLEGDRRGQEVSLSSTDTSILYEGIIPGKDYNCTIYIPPPFDGFFHGNEDSSFLSMEAYAPRIQEDRGADAVRFHSFRGPHSSNILALCTFPTPFNLKDPLFYPPETCCVASVGSLSSLTLWIWLRPGLWRVLASTNELSVHNYDSLGETSPGFLLDFPEKKEDEGKRHAKKRRKRGGRVAVEHVERVPRFLCVRSLCRNHLLVGGSDASLRAFRYDEDASLLIKLFQWTPNTRHPKPIMALLVLPSPFERGEKSTEEAAQRVLLGDTNGVVYAVRLLLRNLPHAGVCAEHRIEPSSVNAMAAAGGVKIVGKHCFQSRFAVVHDSGVVHLVLYTWKGDFEKEKEEDNGTHTLVCLSRLSTGLTAGRGIAWPSSSVYLFVTNEEYVMCIKVDENSGVLELITKKRVNVRCVSGFAVRELTPSVFDVMVSGQGLEYMRFRTPPTKAINV